MIYFSVVFFLCFVLEVHRFYQIWIVSCTYYSISCPPPLGIPITHIWDCLSHSIAHWYFISSSILFFLSLCLLLDNFYCSALWLTDLSFTLFTLPFIQCTVFFISHIVIFTSISLISVFFISCIFYSFNECLNLLSASFICFSAVSVSSSWVFLWVMYLFWMPTNFLFEASHCEF